jgi:predicted enzyme related to lactoylglutathione lyase
MQTRFNPPANAVVWAEIPVKDMEASKRFYAHVLQTSLKDEEGGPNPMAAFAYQAGDAGVSGHIYPGRPAGDGSGPTVHLAVQDTVEAAMERVGAAGGKVVSPVIEIPAGRFAYCLDPDGNSIGLFSR